MGGFERLISGVICALGALLLPARPLIICVGVFVLIDFVIGVAASRTRARRVGRRVAFREPQSVAHGL